MGNCIEILALGTLDRIVPLQLACLLHRGVFLHKGLKQLHTIDPATVAELVATANWGFKSEEIAEEQHQQGPTSKSQGAPAVC